MDTELLNTVGQIAGIGGLALGTFLILFREIIRKSIFPTITKEHAYRLLRLIAFFVWTVALVGIGAWAWTEKNSGGIEQKTYGDMSPAIQGVNGDVNYQVEQRGPQE